MFLSKIFVIVMKISPLKRTSLSSVSQGPDLRAWQGLDVEGVDSTISVDDGTIH